MSYDQSNWRSGQTGNPQNDRLVLSLLLQFVLLYTVTFQSEIILMSIVSWVSQSTLSVIVLSLITVHHLLTRLITGNFSFVFLTASIDYLITNCLLITGLKQHTNDQLT